MIDVAALAADLVAIDSVNPELAPGAAGEAEVARHVARWCERAGLEVELREVAPGRPNVLAVARGSGGGRTLLLNAHMDTVGVEGAEHGLCPVLADGRLYGRGAYDMKGPLAAAMLAVADLRARGLRGDVVLAAVCDEEAASIGSETVAAEVRAGAAIVCEPTEERVCVAHKGFVAFEFETVGRAAHGSRPDLGVDAIARMGRVLVGIEQLDMQLRERPAHPLLGTGSIHASVIDGGREYSSYPASCRLLGERRTVPGEIEAHVRDELAPLLDGVEGSLRLPFAREPFEIGAEEPIVGLLRRHASADGVVGASFWADSALFAAAGIPTVLYGPCGDGAHAAVEWVDVESLERCRRVYAAVAEEFCS